MSSESLERVPSTNPTKETPNAIVKTLQPVKAIILKILHIWKLVVHFVGRDYIAEFLATFVLMVRHLS